MIVMGQANKSSVDKSVQRGEKNLITLSLIGPSMDFAFTLNEMGVIGGFLSKGIASLTSLASAITD